MSSSVLGAIIAGGRAVRMGGGDKALIPVAGRPVLSWLLQDLMPQVDSVIMVANGDAQRFAGFPVTVVGDDPDLPSGPLAGIVTALRLARQQDFSDICVVPGDTPRVPPDLVNRLRAARGPRMVSVAHRLGSAYPVVALWRASAADRAESLLKQGTQAVWRVQADLGSATTSFDDSPEPALRDIDSQADLAALETFFTSPGSGRSG